MTDRTRPTKIRHVYETNPIVVRDEDGWHWMLAPVQVPPALAGGQATFGVEWVFLNPPKVVDGPTEPESN